MLAFYFFCVSVLAQVYNLPLFSARDTAEKMLLVVQKKLAFRNIELQVVKLRKPIDVDVSRPLLIYCEPVPFYPGMLRSVEMVLSRFNSKYLQNIVCNNTHNAKGQHKSVNFVSDLNMFKYIFSLLEIQ